MSKHVSPNSILSDESTFYFILSEQDVINGMNTIIEHTAQLLGLESKTIVRLLLNHFHWEKDTLTDRYWEDPDKLFLLLKLPNPTSTSLFDSDPLSPSSASNQSKKSNSITCRTCQCDKPSKQFYALKCGHQHCLTCWQSYLELKIDPTLNKCPIYCLSRCKEIIEDEQIFRLISNASLKQRYQRILGDAYVDSNRLTCWCPGKSCHMIIQLESAIVDNARMITCDECQFVFCFRCSHEWHDPVQCTLLAAWEKKNQDESMNNQWLQVHTKACPKCSSNIEKNGGCNHMTCRKPGCAYEFCWICLDRWSDHTSHQCNAYRSKDETTSQSKARDDLDRYLHYFTRYQVHNESLKLEEKLVEHVSRHKISLRDDLNSYTNKRALDRAVDVLRLCRSTLKYTYAFAFYLYKNNQADVFEQNQADLSRATEALSGFLEEEMVTTPNHLTKLMDKTSYCFDRRNALLKHCKEGYRDHYWGGLHPY